MKKLLELQPIFPVLKRMTPLLSNQEKVSLFLRDSNFRLRLTDKLREDVLFHLIRACSCSTPSSSCDSTPSATASPWPKS
jgi:hypothetical protein